MMIMMIMKISVAYEFSPFLNKCKTKIHIKDHHPQFWFRNDWSSKICKYVVIGAQRQRQRQKRECTLREMLPTYIEDLYMVFDKAKQCRYFSSQPQDKTRSPMFQHLMDILLKRCWLANSKNRSRAIYWGDIQKGNKDFASKHADKRMNFQLLIMCLAWVVLHSKNWSKQTNTHCKLYE